VLDFELHVERGNPDTDEARFFRTAWEPPESWVLGVFHEGRLHLDITLVATLDEALPPVSTPQVNAAVGRTLALRVDGRGRMRPRILAPDPDDVDLRGLARVLEIELLENGYVRERRRLNATEVDLHNWLLEPFKCAPPSLALDRRACAGWSLRVRGSDDGVLRSWDCDRRWTGEIVLTLDELIERDAAASADGARAQRREPR
jgi:hypothetical protein